jgi:hypothetical protein
MKRVSVCNTCNEWSSSKLCCRQLDAAVEGSVLTGMPTLHDFDNSEGAVNGGGDGGGGRVQA